MLPLIRSMISGLSGSCWNPDRNVRDCHCLYGSARSTLSSPSHATTFKISRPNMSWSRICLSGWSVGIEVSSASNSKEKYESAERNRDMKKGELCAELIKPCVKTYTKTEKKKHMSVHLAPFSCLRVEVNYTLCENPHKDKKCTYVHLVPFLCPRAGINYTV